MKDKAEQSVADRRSFMKMAGISAVAGGAALVSGKTPASADVAKDNADRLYKETDHIKTYYELARF